MWDICNFVYFAACWYLVIRATLNQKRLAIGNVTVDNFCLTNESNINTTLKSNLQVWGETFSWTADSRVESRGYVKILCTKFPVQAGGGCDFLDSNDVTLLHGDSQ